MVQHHRSASPFEPRFGYCRALRQGRRILVAGTAPIGSDGESCPEGARAQAARCFEIIGEALEALGGSLQHVLRTRMYILDAADAEAVGEVHGAVFRGVDPVATMVVVQGLIDPRWRVEIEAEAELPDTL